MSVQFPAEWLRNTGKSAGYANIRSIFRGTIRELLDAMLALRRER